MAEILSLNRNSHSPFPPDPQTLKFGDVNPTVQWFRQDPLVLSFIVMLELIAWTRVPLVSINDALEIAKAWRWHWNVTVECRWDLERTSTRTSMFGA